MKLNFIIAAFAITTATQAISTEIPTGTLSLNKAMVRRGEVPALKWTIHHPGEYFDGKKVLKKTRMEVFMIGTGVTSKRGKVEHVTESYLQIKGIWKEVFTGKGSEVDPAKVIISQILNKGDTISFKGRFPEKFTNWRYDTDSFVVTLKNGDSVPHDLGENAGSTLESYLAPYIVNYKLVLGPHDFIYCAELTHKRTSSNAYDLQDAIVLIRFSEAD